MGDINILTLLANEYGAKMPDNPMELLEFMEIVFNNVALLKDINIDFYKFRVIADNKPYSIQSN